MYVINNWINVINNWITNGNLGEVKIVQYSLGSDDFSLKQT